MKTIALAEKPTVKTSEPIQRRKDRRISLPFVMEYQFDPVIYRMVDKHNWDEADTRDCF